MRLPRFALPILSVLVLLTATLGLRYVTARASASGEQTCVQYRTARNSPYGKPHLTTDIITGKTIRTSVQPFTSTAGWIDPRLRVEYQLHSWDRKWLVWASFHGDDFEFITDIWVAPVELGLPQLGKAVKVTSRRNATLSYWSISWSHDNRMVLVRFTDINHVRDDELPSNGGLILAKRDQADQWTTQTVLNDPISEIRYLYGWSRDSRYFFTYTPEDRDLLLEEPDVFIRWDASTLKPIDSFGTKFAYPSVSPNMRYIAIYWERLSTITITDLFTKTERTISIPGFTAWEDLEWHENSEWLAIHTRKEWSAESIFTHIIGMDGTERLNIIERPSSPRSDILGVWMDDSPSLVYDSHDSLAQQLIAYDPVTDTKRTLIQRQGWDMWYPLKNEAGTTEFAFAADRHVVDTNGKTYDAFVDGSTGKVLINNVNDTRYTEDTGYFAHKVDSAILDGSARRSDALAVVNTVNSQLKVYTAFEGEPFASVEYILDVHARHFFFTASLKKDEGTSTSVDDSDGSKQVGLYMLDPATGTIRQMLAEANLIREAYDLDTNWSGTRYGEVFDVIVTKGEQKRLILFDVEGNRIGDYDIGGGMIDTDGTSDPSLIQLSDLENGGVPYIAVSAMRADSSAPYAPYIIHSSGHNGGVKIPIVSSDPNYTKFLDMRWLHKDRLLAARFSNPRTPNVILVTVVDPYGKVRYSTAHPAMYDNNGNLTQIEWSTCR